MAATNVPTGIAQRVGRLGTHSAPPSVSRPPAHGGGAAAETGLKYHHNNALLYGPDAVVWGHVAQFLTARDIGMFSMTCRGKAAFVPYLSAQVRAFWRFVQWQHTAAAEAANNPHGGLQTPKLPPYAKDAATEEGLSDAGSGKPQLRTRTVRSSSAGTVTSADAAADAASRQQNSHIGANETASNPTSVSSRHPGAAGAMDSAVPQRDASVGVASDAGAVTDSASRAGHTAGKSMHAVDTAATMPSANDAGTGFAASAQTRTFSSGLGVSDQLSHEFSPARVLIPSPPCAVDSVDLSQSVWSTDEHNRADRWTCSISMNLPLFRFLGAILSARVASYVQDSPNPEASLAARSQVVSMLAAAAQIGPDTAQGAHVGDMVHQLSAAPHLGIVPASLMCTVYGTLSTQSPFLHAPQPSLSDEATIHDPARLDDGAFLARLRGAATAAAAAAGPDLGLPAALLPDYRRERFVTPLQAAIDVAWMQELRQKREQSLRAPWWCLRVLAELRRREDAMREHVFPRLSMYHAQREMVEDWETRMQWRGRLIDWLRSLVVHWQLPMPLLVDAVALLDLYTLHHGRSLTRTSMQLVAIVSFLHQLRSRGASAEVLKPIQEVARDYTLEDFQRTERSLLDTVGPCMHTLFQTHNIPFGGVCTRESGVLDAAVDLPTAGMAAPATAPRHAEALLADAVRVARMHSAAASDSQDAHAAQQAAEAAGVPLPHASAAEVEAAAAAPPPVRGRGRGGASNFTPTTVSTATRRDLPSESGATPHVLRSEVQLSEHGTDARTDHTDESRQRSLQQSVDATEQGEGDPTQQDAPPPAAREGHPPAGSPARGALRLSPATVAGMGVQALPVRLSDRSTGRWGGGGSGGQYLMRPLAAYGAPLPQALLLALAPLTAVQRLRTALRGAGATDPKAALQALLASTAASLAQGGAGGSPLGACAPWAGTAAAITQLSGARSRIAAYSWGAQDGVGGVAFTLPQRSVGTGGSNSTGRGDSGRQQYAMQPMTPRELTRRISNGRVSSPLGEGGAAKPTPPEGSRPVSGVSPRVASALGGGEGGRPRRGSGTADGASSPAVHSKGAWSVGKGGGNGSGGGSGSPGRRRSGSGSGGKGGARISAAIPAGMTGFGSGIVVGSPQRRASGARASGLKLPSVAEGGGAVTGGGVANTPSGEDRSPLLSKGAAAAATGDDDAELQAPLPAESHAADKLPEGGGGDAEGGAVGGGSQMVAAASTVHALLGAGPNSMLSVGGLMTAFGSAMWNSAQLDEGGEGGHSVRAQAVLSAKSPVDTAPPPAPLHAFTHGLHRRLAQHFAVPMSSLLPAVVHVTPLHPLRPDAHDRGLRRRLQVASFHQPALCDVPPAHGSGAVPPSASGMSSGVSLLHAVRAMAAGAEDATGIQQDLAAPDKAPTDLSAPLTSLEGVEGGDAGGTGGFVSLPPGGDSDSTASPSSPRGSSTMQRQKSSGGASTAVPSLGAPAVGMGGGGGASVAPSALLPSGDNLEMGAGRPHSHNTPTGTPIADGPILSLPEGSAPPPPFALLETPLLPGAMLAGPMMRNPDASADVPTPVQLGTVRGDAPSATGPLLTADLQLMVACGTYKLVDLLLQLLDGAWIVPAVPAIHECVFLCMRHWELEGFSTLTRAFACVHMGILCTPRVRRRSGVFNWYRVAYAMLHTDRAAVDEVLYLLYRRADANGLLAPELHVVLQALPHLQARIEQDQQAGVVE